jgi:hypothetical protein
VTLFITNTTVSGLLNPEIEGPTILPNGGNYLPIDKAYKPRIPLAFSNIDTRTSNLPQHG